MDVRRRGNTWVKIKGRPKCSSPFELIQNSKSKAKATESPEKERRQKPGCHKPPPLKMNLVLEIRLLGKTVLGRLSLKIPLFPRLFLLWCDAPI